MGCGPSSPEMAAQTNASKEIDKELKMNKKVVGTEVKVLLLGTGASGKSTIARQMKVMYMNGFTDKDTSIFTEIIFFNIIKNMKTLVVQAEKFGYDLAPGNRTAAEELKNMSMQLSDVELTSERGSGIAALWTDPGIQQTVERQNEFQFDDSAPYYFDALERIAQENYKPTTDDILHVRAKTTGIVETDFVHKGLHFRMVDVGGQRNERKKWIHCFQDVTAIIFVVAMSEYDLKLEEDLVTNRMAESLKLFNDVVNNRWFAQTNVILFLNKKDIFEKKIKKVPLTVCFPEYTGPQEFDAAADYILNKFQGMNKTAGPQVRHIYSHRTCATDTQNIQTVWLVVSDIFLANNLRTAGFSP